MKDEEKEYMDDVEKEKMRMERVRHNYFDAAMGLIMDREIFFIVDTYTTPLVHVNSFTLSGGYTVKKGEYEFIEFPVLRSACINKKTCSFSVKEFDFNEVKEIPTCNFPKQILHKIFSRILSKKNLNILADRIILYFDSGDMVFQILTSEEFTSLTGIPDIDRIMDEG